jgi:hypothetical protein
LSSLQGRLLSLSLLRGTDLADLVPSYLYGTKSQLLGLGRKVIYLLSSRPLNFLLTQKMHMRRVRVSLGCSKKGCRLDIKKNFQANLQCIAVIPALRRLTE